MRRLEFCHKNKNPVAAPPDLLRNHWYRYYSNYIPNTEVQGLYRTLHALSTIVQGKWPFQNNVGTAQNQSLHLRIDVVIQMILLSMLPEEIWRCEDWIFFTKLKCSDCAGTVRAPPNKLIYIMYVH